MVFFLVGRAEGKYFIMWERVSECGVMRVAWNGF